MPTRCASMPLDGEMGLAGIGGAEHGGDAAAALKDAGVGGEGSAHNSRILNLVAVAARGTRGTQNER